MRLTTLTKTLTFALLLIIFTAPMSRLPLAQDAPDGSGSRGYLTTPQELRIIAEKAARGIQPYDAAVENVLEWAEREWDYSFDERETCRNSDNPAWIDDQRGAGRLYARALAYHLSGDDKYAEGVQQILERIMSQVRAISTEQQQCQLNLGWGAPELVASADLIEDYWRDHTCTGPLSPMIDETDIGEGSCKVLLQNWLAKHVYPLVSYAAIHNQSNWGAAGTNASAYIADYLWDRPELMLQQRVLLDLRESTPAELTPAQAYRQSIQLMLDRNNGLRVDYHSNWTCDTLDGEQQHPNWEPVKSQITENGVIPEDARRAEYCNIPAYQQGEYENYPQVHLNNNIQQCELMLRRGDRSCYDNVAANEIPEFTYRDPDGVMRTTHLYAGRGSIERAINAIIIDANTEWRHDSALEVAYRYYIQNGRLGHVEAWLAQMNRPTECSQGICFGTLTHGFAPGEVPVMPPVVAPPGSETTQTQGTS